MFAVCTWFVGRTAVLFFNRQLFWSPFRRRRNYVWVRSALRGTLAVGRTERSARDGSCFAHLGQEPREVTPSFYRLRPPRMARHLTPRRRLNRFVGPVYGEIAWRLCLALKPASTQIVIKRDSMTTHASINESLKNKALKATIL